MERGKLEGDRPFKTFAAGDAGGAWKIGYAPDLAIKMRGGILRLRKEIFQRGPGCSVNSLLVPFRNGKEGRGFSF
ncbi:MAG: hypothetical protein CMN03_09935 [Roseibacillus sp.]|nr:hypothetical protein [Roseibacillus sp.]